MGRAPTIVQRLMDQLVQLCAVEMVFLSIHWNLGSIFALCLSGQSLGMFLIPGLLKGILGSNKTMAVTTVATRRTEEHFPAALGAVMMLALARRGLESQIGGRRGGAWRGSLNIARVGVQRNLHSDFRDALFLFVDIALVDARGSRALLL
jgi:hypothetical protein